MTVVVELRPVETRDLDVLFELQRDPESYTMAGVVPRDRESYDAHWKKVRAEPTNVLLAIVVEEKVVGSVMSWLADGHRMLGYWVDRAHWGRGIASEAVTQFLARVTERPIIAHVARHNAGSRRVLVKCGFTIVDEGLVAQLGGDPHEEFVFRFD